jgi:hypothetical protein
MNVVRLMGGLGNQMFQYAFGRRLAQDSGRPVRFDAASGFRRDAYRRRFALGAFSAEVVPALDREIPTGMAWPRPWSRLARAGWTCVPKPWRRVVYDPSPFRYAASVVAGDGPDAYYFGYWQNEGYFLPVADLLRRDFMPRAPLSGPCAGMLAQITDCRSVSLHVRRNLGIGADGRPIQRARDFHGTLEAEYYRRALEAVGVEAGTVCFVFSDDPRWPKENLKLPIPCRFASDLGATPDVDELLLMAACQHHVIANSSFGWWGAWLGRNPGKVVVAPRSWVQGPSQGADDICPKTWIRV